MLITLTYKYNWSYILKYTLKLFTIFLLSFVSTSIFAEKNVQFLINTSKGNIVIETYPEKAPITVKNFESYVNKGFYNDTIFHRVIDGFMIQGGGFTKDMSQKQTDAPIKIESDNGLKNKKYTIAMARTSIPDSATSQFFINVKNNDFLDYTGQSNPGYCVFGKVIEGQDVVDKIGKLKTRVKNGMGDVPIKTVKINSIKVNQQIVIDLRRDDIYDKCYEYSTRKNIKKAERNNLICKIYSCNQMTSKLASDFHEVYINTMERNQANKEYYYSLGYFENIRNRYPDKALFVFVYQEKKVVSVELILHNEYMGFSYLGGTDSKYYNCRPNDYLKHNIIFYLKEKGVYFFNMGGGHEINDGIFKYKKNFCIDGVFDYYIGRVIHNQTTYDQIVNSWKGVTCIDDINKYDNYLLKYHFGSKI